ncbi:MAG: hypothetical protein ACKOXO_03690 [Cyanobium sp.]
MALGLKTAGTLSALIFLISSIHEVLCINNLYASQRFLIGLLLLFLSIWAWLEVKLISRRLDAQIARTLSLVFRPRPFAWCKTRGPNALIRG